MNTDHSWGATVWTEPTGNLPRPMNAKPMAIGPWSRAQCTLAYVLVNVLRD